MPREVGSNAMVAIVTDETPASRGCDHPDSMARVPGEQTAGVKARYRQPCNHCGECCRLQLCRVAELLTENAPCPFLSRDNRCGLVLVESESGSNPLLRLALGIGFGCSMPDEDTTEAEIIAFELACIARANDYPEGDQRAIPGTS